MKPKNGQTNEVVIKKQAGAIAAVNIEQFADEGFDNVDSKSLALPFLKVLGQLSPQVTQGDSQFIESARPGMIYNTVTDELYNGQKGIVVIPCYYKLEYIEWRDRGQDGSSAPINVYPADSDIMSKTTRGDDGKDRLENGNYIEETASHYVMIVEEGKSSTALITMKSTQKKKSKTWNSMMQSRRMKGKKGFFTPPSWATAYRLKTTKESNSQNSWYGWVIEFDRYLDDPKLSSTLEATRAFYESAKQSDIFGKVDFGKEESVAKQVTDQSTPF